MSQVTAASYPPIVECRLFQKSNAEPGVCRLATNYETGEVPPITTLTFLVDGVTHTFPDMKVSQSPRIHRDKVVIVLEDNRWKLREVYFSESFNARDELGRLGAAATQKTITELWALIAAAAGISITVGTVPSFNPPAPWCGVTGADAAAQLLRDTGCVMVWDAVTATYRISTAGTGALPDLTSRTYSPGPNLQVKDLHVDSSPILYESDPEIEAVMVDSSGELVTLGSLVALLDFFIGFSAEALTDRSRYQQSAFRLWRVTTTAYPEALDADRLILQDKRATTIAQGVTDQLSASAHPATDSGSAFATFPEYQFVNSTAANDSDETLTILPGTPVFHSSSPILIVNSAGVLQETAKVHTSYHVIETDGTLRSDRETRNISGTGVDLTVVVPWLKPTLSDLPDKNTAASQWATIHSAVADALETRYSALKQTASVWTVIGAAGSGQVGAVLYEFGVGWRGKIRTTWAFNFIPANWRNIRA